MEADGPWLSIARRVRRLLPHEAAEHAHEALVYISAISWTHTFLPALGGPVLVSLPEIMHRRFGGIYLVFVWMYVSIITGICYWWFHKAGAKAKALLGTRPLPLDASVPLGTRIVAAAWDNSSKAMAWIAAYAWAVAMLGSLPTFTAFQAILSAAAMTCGIALAVLVGQHGRGPLAKALLSPERDVLRWTIFFAAWMTAVVWVGALTVCVDCALSNCQLWETVRSRPSSSLLSAWVVALSVLGARWAWLSRGGPHVLSSGVGGGDAMGLASARAFEIYPAERDAALTVGLLAAPEGPPSAAGGGGGVPPTAGGGPGSSGAGRVLPSLSQLATATIGLASLAGSWVGTVALNYASAALWSDAAWPAPPPLGTASYPAAVLAAAAYSAALSAAAVLLVSCARAARQRDAERAAEAGDAAAETLALRRSSGLVAETVALAVASGWAWFNAISTALPSTVGSGFVLARGVGAGLVTTAGVLGTMALRPLRASAAEAAAEASTADAMEAAPPPSQAYRPPPIPADRPREP